MEHIESALQGATQALKHVGAYILARLSESSTWAGVTAAILGAAALEKPYSYMAIAAGVVGVLVKQTKAAE